MNINVEISVNIFISQGKKALSSVASRISSQELIVYSTVAMANSCFQILFFSWLSSPVIQKILPGFKFLHAEYAVYIVCVCVPCVCLCVCFRGLVLPLIMLVHESEPFAEIDMRTRCG